MTKEINRRREAEARRYHDVQNQTEPPKEIIKTTTKEATKKKGFLDWLLGN